MGHSELEIEIKLTGELINTDESINREYVVIREHNGAYDLLPAIFDKATGTLRFKSGLYSNYAIAYKDAKVTEPTAEPTAKPTVEPNNNSNDADNSDNNDTPETANQAEKTNAPKTGDHMDSIAAVWLFIMAMACIGAVVVVKRRGKSE